MCLNKIVHEEIIVVSVFTKFKLRLRMERVFYNCWLYAKIILRSQFSVFFQIIQSKIQLVQNLCNFFIRFSTVYVCFRIAFDYHQCEGSPFCFITVAILDPVLVLEMAYIRANSLLKLNSNLPLWRLVSFIDEIIKSALSEIIQCVALPTLSPVFCNYHKIDEFG